MESVLIVGRRKPDKLNRDRRALSRLAVISLALLLLTAGSTAIIILISYNGTQIHDHPQDRAPRLYLNATEADDHILLTWNSIPWDSEFGFTVFEISRAYEGQSWTLIETVNINETSYADHSVSRYRGCMYLVHAIPDQNHQNPGWNFVWVDGQSNWTSLGKRASSVPLGLAVRPMDGKVSLTWNAPTEDGGHWVSSYFVYRGTSSENLSLVGNFSASSIYYGQDYRDQGLVNHITYFYAVSANNSISESNRSNIVSVTPLPSPQLTAKRISSETDYDQILQINWSLSHDPILAVAGFKLYLMESSPQAGMRLVVSLNASEPYSSSVNLTYPHDSGILFMAVEYQDHNVSYSEPVWATVSHPIDGSIGADWSAWLTMLVLSLGALAIIGAFLWKRRHNG